MKYQEIYFTAMGPRLILNMSSLVSVRAQCPYPFLYTPNGWALFSPRENSSNYLQ